MITLNDAATAELALSSDYWDSLGHGVGAILSYAVLGLALMVVGFFALDAATPGPLRQLVRDGRPNAVAVSATGLISMALIVVLAIYASSGKLVEGLIATTVYGLVAIVAQVISVRVVELVLGVDIGELLAAPKYDPKSLVVAAAHLALGLVVAVAIL